eukprot:GHVQ01042869.1.p2 GENE.GHVQ01042869.1~~GHVQ01042869.1.p2  ORF type:complete len:125 (+),score=12.39 GHVQ01042869.1:440-814(+)
MIGVSLVPAIAMSAGTLCLLETPRWLVSQGREAEALTNLRAVTYYGSDPDLARARALHVLSTLCLHHCILSVYTLYMLHCMLYTWYILYFLCRGYMLCMLCMLYLLCMLYMLCMLYLLYLLCLL